jgi:hypothetical protein
MTKQKLHTTDLTPELAEQRKALGKTTVRKAFDGGHQPLVKRWGNAARVSMRGVTAAPLDRVRNWQFVRGDRKIALVRDRHGSAKYYNLFLKWIAERLPDVRSRLELNLLPCDVRDWSQYALVVPWIAETLLCRSPRVREQAFELTDAADKHGVPVINRPERLLNISKYDSAQRIARLGVRVPRTERIEDVAQFKRHLNGMRLPLLVREDLTHGGHSPMFLVRHPHEARDIPLKEFSSPIAVEFVDVRSPKDGLVRKYRYMAMGDTGVAHTLQCSQHWEVRADVRVINEATRSEEILYADAPDPHHDLLQHVRRGLELDFVGFDYSLDHEGQLIVWEINILPGLGIPTGPNRGHLVPPIERAMAATVRLFLQRAQLNVPLEVEELLQIHPRTPALSTTHAA